VPAPASLYRLLTDFARNARILMVCDASQTAFTLVELLIVNAITAILAALSLKTTSIRKKTMKKVNRYCP
jgi:prepilin-type N-terminal cleavage/methylation domain-containing protein